MDWIWQKEAFLYCMDLAYARLPPDIETGYSGFSRISSKFKQQ
ncbi:MULTISPECIES: hypothetical protein [Paenibacillus]|nr:MULTISPECIES: hypothetical protein [Paenibacillus]